jgi:hypothetical protein
LITQGNRIGMSEATLGQIVGHKVSSMTARYVSHNVDAVLLAEADRLAEHVRELLGDGIRDHQKRVAAERVEAEPVEIYDDDLPLHARA